VPVPPAPVIVSDAVAGAPEMNCRTPFDLPPPTLMAFAWIVLVAEPRLSVEPVWALPLPLVPRLRVPTLIRFVLDAPLASVRTPRMLVPLPTFRLAVVGALRVNELRDWRSTVAVILVPP